MKYTNGIKCICLSKVRYFHITKSDPFPKLGRLQQSHPPNGRMSDQIFSHTKTISILRDKQPKDNFTSYSTK